MLQRALIGGPEHATLLTLQRQVAERREEAERIAQQNADEKVRVSERGAVRAGEGEIAEEEGEESAADGSKTAGGGEGDSDCVTGSGDGWQES